MLKFDGGVGSSRYSSPGVLGFFFTIAGFFRWLRCVSEAKYRFNGLRFCLNNINLELFLSYIQYTASYSASRLTTSQIAHVDHVTRLSDWAIKSNGVRRILQRPRKISMRSRSSIYFSPLIAVLESFSTIG